VDRLIDMQYVLDAPVLHNRELIHSTKPSSHLHKDHGTIIKLKSSKKKKIALKNTTEP
jgi:hypothetical protein